MIKLTALLSVYNGEKYIEETIDSVLQQTYENFEFIIIDDGSTDRTIEIINSYKDSRIKVFSFYKNKGIPTALNYGIEKATGDYIVKIDGDDIQHPSRFAKQLEFMVENPEIVLSKTLVNYFADNEKVEQTLRYKTIKEHIEPYKNETKTPEKISERLKWYCCIPHTTMMIRTDVIKKYKYRDIPLFEDYDLFYRLNEDKLLMGHLDMFSVNMRVSDNSTTVYRKDLFNECAYFIKEKQLNKFKQNKSVYIWGAGSFGYSVLSLLLKKDWKIKGFIDSNGEIENTTIMDKKVYSPRIIDGSKKNKVIIASQPGMFEIINLLRKHGYESEEDFMVLR